MQLLTLERLQSLLTELSALIQFIVAILGLVAILLPFFQRISIYHDDTTYILPTYMTSFLHKTFLQLGVSQLMMYIRPQEYYDDLSKKLSESDLAKTSQVANICLASAIEAKDESAYVSGLVNTGNSCFLNSVLQAMSSLPHLHTYLEHVSTISTAGVPLPVTRSLLKTMRTLTKPLYRRSSFRPVDIVTALSSNRRIISREQQDAQEFFQLVSSAMENEGQKISKTQLLGGGLKDLLNQSSIQGVIRSEWILKKQQQRQAKSMTMTPLIENPFTGLLANRLSCMQCGYTGAIRHFSFNNIQLSVPNKYTTTLSECLTQFTSMEYLQDASCRKCSFGHTIKSLTLEIDLLKQQHLSKKKDNKKKRDIITKLVNLEKAKREIEYRLAVGRIEEEEEEEMTKLPLLRVSRMSSKQAMLAKPPKVLCLHISRSAFLNTGAIYKNTCQLLFPEYLDISPFSTNGTLHTQPNVPISTPLLQQSGYYYRLMSVVVHYGSHSFGHFVAFKRRIYADQCQCHQCSSVTGEGEVWKCQNSWYRISDTKVDECSIEDVLRSNPYMLLYELVEKDDFMQQEESEVEAEVEVEKEEEEEDMSVISSVTSQDNDYTAITSNIPMDESTREALRIANSLLTSDLRATKL